MSISTHDYIDYAPHLIDLINGYSNHWEVKNMELINNYILLTYTFLSFVFDQTHSNKIN
jgi:hypothetical protein